MSWITFDNLKRFWKGIRTNPVTFTGEIDLQNTTRYKGEEIATKNDIPRSITVDSELSSTSTNPVQNKIIKRELDKKWNTDDTTLKIKSAERYPLHIESTEDSRFDVVLGSSGLAVSDDNGQLDISTQQIEFRNKDASSTIIKPLLDGQATVQIVLKDVLGSITWSKNIATEDYVNSATADVAKISNGHLVINGSELWVE